MWSVLLVPRLAANLADDGTGYVDRHRGRHDRDADCAESPDDDVEAGVTEQTRMLAAGDATTGAEEDSDEPLGGVQERGCTGLPLRPLPTRGGHGGTHTGSPTGGEANVSMAAILQRLQQASSAGASRRGQP